MSAAHLKPAYIQLDQTTLSPIVRIVLQHRRLAKSKPWIWYDILFKFHDCNVFSRSSGCVRRDHTKWSQTSVRSVIRLSKKIRTGIPACAKTPDILADTIQGFMKCFERLDRPVPHLPGSALTNGCGFKVNLLTLSDKWSTNFNYTPCEGVNELNTKGFEGILGTFNWERSGNGFYAHSMQCTQQGMRFTVVGIDPGAKKIFCAMRAPVKVGAALDASEFSNLHEYSSVMYRVMCAHCPCRLIQIGRSRLYK